ncbi:MAG: AAA family ATPase [Veillonella sp.]|uniref:AAA family ATPase n=1 Tax=Veillonella sp. TaxID=1926307 RepID=UPI001B539436|nr:AAA family ATPase [Veillonella sp.]NCB95744.1 cobalamin biosynthesis protein CobQ [Negativicutes bacterium]MBK7922017.1 AAA family ATPase [Veillonella sp.]MBP6922700.1 AAA family ATPase [Veillonella sp.]MBP9517305.1 AAA family ATPase [Veillonella sp.]MBP9550976.1 AAA family ATPase [Veillonella sp.]
MGRIIALVSGKGGVGKTTVTACLGVALSQQGHRVLMTDGDFGLRDLDLVVGKQNEVIFDVADVCGDRELANDAIIPIHKNLDLLPASQALRWEDVGRNKYRKLIKKLADEYDYVLVDAPAGIGRGADAILNFAHRILIVTQPLWVSLRNAGRVIQVCREKRQFDYAIVFNAMQQIQVDTDMETMMRTLGAEYIGTVLPYAENVIHYTQEGQLHTLQDDNFMPMLKPLISYIESGHTWEDHEILQAYESHKQPGASSIALFEELVEHIEKATMKEAEESIMEDPVVETEKVELDNIELEPLEPEETEVVTFTEENPVHRNTQLLMRQRQSKWRRRR